MQFATHGLIEIETKKVIRSFGRKAFLFGLPASSFFTTSSCGLPCEVVWGVHKEEFLKCVNKVFTEPLWNIKVIDK